MEDAENELNEIPEIAFYNKLDVEAPVTNDIDRYLNICNECHKSYFIKRNVRKLVRNYDIYKDLSVNNSYDKYCRYFKYWLYRLREMQFPKMSYGRSNEWERCILCVWNKLEENADNHQGKCNFKNENISYAFIKVKKALDDICSIKDKLKNDNKENPETRKCLKINGIKRYYLDYLLVNIGSISSTNSWNDEYFKIDKTCSLMKIYDFLQEEQCPPEVKEGCQESKVFETPSPVLRQHCSAESCDNLSEICQQHCSSKPCTSAERVTQSDCTPTTCDGPEKLWPEYCAQHPNSPVSISEEGPVNPAKNPYLQLPVTVFSSVVGTIFFFLFLYKFTPFRSWFLNRIGSKDTLKHKMKQEMDREFLGAPFQPPYRDDQNSRPRVGYSQN